MSTHSHSAVIVPERRSKGLGAFERRWTAGVFDTLYPANAVDGMLGSQEVDLLEFHTDYLRRLPAMAHIGLRAAIFLVAFTPLFFVGIPLPLHRLSPEKRLRHMQKWEVSKLYFIRELITLIKAATIMGYASHPKVKAALGMGGQP